MTEQPRSTLSDPAYRCLAALRDVGNPMTMRQLLEQLNPAPGEGGSTSRHDWAAAQARLTDAIIELFSRGWIDVRRPSESSVHQHHDVFDVPSDLVLSLR